MLSTKALSGSFIAASAQVIRMFLQITTTAIISRILTPDDFGVVAMAMTYTAFIALLTDFGFSSAIIQAKTIDKQQLNAILSINALICFVAISISWQLSCFAADIYNDERVAEIILILALAIPFNLLSAPHRAMLARRMQWIRLHSITLSAHFTGPACAIILALTTGLDYWSIAIGYIITSITMFSLSWIFCDLRLACSTNLRMASPFLKFGLNLTLSGFLNYFHRQFDNILIGRHWGSADLGYYNRAYTLLLIPLGIVNGPIGSAIVPILSRLQDHPRRWRCAFLDAISMATLFGAGIAGLLIVSSRPLVLLLLGNEWAGTIDVFQYLSLSIFAATPMNTASWIYISLGRTRRLLVWSAFATFCFVLSYIIGLPYGIEAVALSYSITVCLLLLPCLYVAVAGSPVKFMEVLYSIIPIIVIALQSTIFAIFLTKYFDIDSIFIVFVVEAAIYLTFYIAFTSSLIWNASPYARLKGHIRRIAEGVRLHDVQRYLGSGI